MNNEKPSFFAVIPANVRYSDLIPHAKLLFGEITALSNTTGTCYASNAYFSSLYGVSTRQVSEWISDLEKKGFITCKIDASEGNRRYISITGDYRRKVPDPIEEKFQTYGRKVPDPIEEKFQYNNTVINTDIIILPEEKEKSGKIYTIEEVLEGINKAKIQSDFFYKVGDDDSLINTIADFLEHPSIKKKDLTLKNVERHLKKWLKPSYETDDDRKTMMKNYYSSQRKKSNSYVEKDDLEEEKKNAEKIKILSSIESSLQENQRSEIIERAKKELLEEGKDPTSFGFKHLLKFKYNKILMQDYSIK